MKVAIQGELGSFSHEAAMRLVPGCVVMACSRSVEVFAKLISRAADAAVIPIENSLAGSVTEHYDLLLASKVFIQLEFYLRIVHNLIAAPGVKLQSLRRALSHPVALDQCRTFFARNRLIQPVPFYDTAGSVKHLMDNCLADSAAIASRSAARIYRARVLAAGIEDNKQNFTRFFLIRRSSRIPPGADKTSIAFSLKNVAGALHQALGVFARRKISLSKIESRPVPGRPWEYVFFADFLRGNDRGARDAVSELKDLAQMVKVLGIYKAG